MTAGADPWGRHQPPLTQGRPTPPLPPRLAELAALTDPTFVPDDRPWRFPKPDELPEVQALAGEGWRALDGNPQWAPLPALWPVQHRGWVPDRLPRVSVRTVEGEGRWVEPENEYVHQDRLEHDALVLARCGLPAAPPGRLWLLRSPWPSLGLFVVLRLLVRRATERSGRFFTSPDMTEAARKVLGWTEDELWSWWTGAEADAARAWRARGRSGEDAAGVVLAGLGPDETAALAAPGPAGESGLSEAQAVAWSKAVQTVGSAAIATIHAWRRLGLPADPPPDRHHALAHVAPEDAAAWFAVGFDLAAVGILRGMPLPDALAWREAGLRRRRGARADGARPDVDCGGGGGLYSGRHRRGRAAAVGRSRLRRRFRPGVD